MRPNAFKFARGRLFGTGPAGLSTPPAGPGEGGGGCDDIAITSITLSGGDSIVLTFDATITSYDGEQDAFEATDDDGPQSSTSVTITGANEITIAFARAFFGVVTFTGPDVSDFDFDGCPLTDPDPLEGELDAGDPTSGCVNGAALPDALILRVAGWGDGMHCDGLDADYPLTRVAPGATTWIGGFTLSCFTTGDRWRATQNAPPGIGGAKASGSVLGSYTPAGPCGTIGTMDVL